MKRKIFCSIAAQHDNLGDIVIRRTALKAYLSGGHEAVIFTGNMPPGYVEAFGFTGRVSLTANPGRFQLLVLAHSLSRGAHFIFAPGPHIISDKWRPLVKSSALALTVAVVRMTGGKVFVVGRSLRGRSRASSVVERAIARMSTAYAVRDTVSGRAIGIPLARIPDLAFAHAPSSMDQHQKRTIVAFSFRSDSHINIDAISPLIAKCQSEGFRVVLVSQVRRDDEQHAKLARLLSVDTLLWGDKTHLQQEQCVEGLYKQCQAVISNRLHALILGAVSGGIPVEYSIGKSDKIGSTLKPWISQLQVVSNTESLDEHEYEFLDANQNSRVLQEVEIARSEAQRFLDEATAHLLGPATK